MKRYFTSDSVADLREPLCRDTTRRNARHCCHARSAATRERRSPREPSSGTNWSRRGQSSANITSHQSSRNVFKNRLKIRLSRVL